MITARHSMGALVATRPGVMLAARLPVPDEVRKGEVRVRTAFSAISAGTELRMLNDSDEAFPVVGGFGYMSSGQVDAVGPEVEGLESGDRAVASAPGCHRGMVVLRADRVAKLPDEVTLHAAAGVYWGVPGLRGIVATRPTLRDTVLVVGLGPFGLALVQLLRRSCRRPIAIDQFSRRAETAARLGAGEAISLELTTDDQLRTRVDEEPPDVVFEMSGSQQGLELALRVAAPHARICLIGAQRPQDQFELFRPVHDKGLHLMAFHRRGARPIGGPHDPRSDALREGVELTHAGRLNPLRLVSRTVPWRQAHLGVMLRWTPSRQPSPTDH